ncbi:MAG: hypothetical protein COC09_06610 [Gammaproteobacteria bacterium]|nr:glycosyltransferase [Gammaproteobacteria bacterium]PCH63131.1 MAG: hypothetical protein COC09_06610 [Gammaproteobacteria bacterium]
MAPNTLPDDQLNVIILITESPSQNGYIESLINAYIRAGHTVICDAHNFFFSNHTPDFIHIHWPERLYKWLSIEGIKKTDIHQTIKNRLAWYKSRNVKIIYTIHNLQPHGSHTNTEKDIYKTVLNHADILLHHCNKSIELVQKIYPFAQDKKNVVCPHGDYLIHYRNIPQLDARKKYNIPPEKIVTLNFGTQKPYKNTNLINEAFDQLKIDSKFLFIAGRYQNPGKNALAKLYYRFLSMVAQKFGSPKKKVLHKAIPTEEIPYLLNSADIVFLGQEHGLNSGLIALAATYSKPVVCPNIGCFKESIKEWQHASYQAGNAADAANALNKIYDKVLDNKKRNTAFDNTKWLADSSWDKHVERIPLVSDS